MNGLPRVTIKYGNGALGQTLSSADGLMSLVVCGAVAVSGSFEIGKLYSIRKLGGLTALGVTEQNNALLYKTVKEFYTEASEGTRVYICGYGKDTSIADALDVTKDYCRNIIETANGEIRGFAITGTSDAEFDLQTVMLNAQALGDWSERAKYAPIFTIVDYVDFDGDADGLTDLTKLDYNRVGVVVGSTGKHDSNQAVGLVAGRIARNSVNRNIGRVADGALRVLNIYADGEPIETADTDTIYDKGYITFRTFTGMAGYYIADDRLATKDTDDYNHLTARRTIDKAYRLAYITLVSQLLDNVEVNTNGTMLSPVLSAWEQMVINGVASNMQGELSDDGDGGVQCSIDPSQNVLATGTVNVELRVRPFGYARYINVLLGFSVN